MINLQQNKMITKKPCNKIIFKQKITGGMKVKKEQSQTRNVGSKCLKYF